MSTELSITAASAQFTANGTTVGGFVARPADGQPAPAILLIHEWWGLTDHIREIAERYARQGFVAAAVDLYDGTLTRDAQQAAKLMESLDPAKALDYLATAVAHLRAAPDVTAVGVTGFCMGGVYTILTACHNQVEAAVAYYGIPDDLSVLSGLSCPLLFFGGERDQWITVEKIQRLEDTLQQAAKEVEVKIYPGADHAFFNNTRPEVYSPSDAQDAWQRTIDFFNHHLRQGQPSATPATG